MLMRLRVLPPPHSSSLFPPLSLKQIAHLKGALRTGQKRCFWCGRPISRKAQTLTIDHVIPQSKGGGFSLDNLVASCGPCNLMKDSADLVEWLQRIDHIAGRLRGMVAMD